MAASTEEILEEAARKGAIDDLSQWPRVLEALLKRLHDIVHNDFPIPAESHIPDPAALQPLSSQDVDPVVTSTPPALTTGEDVKEGKKQDTTEQPAPTQSQTVSATQDSLKENEDPGDGEVVRAETDTDIGSMAPPPPVVRTTFGYDVAAADATSLGSPPPTVLPAALHDLYTHAHQTLADEFPLSPPHTLQRLAELILQPRRHYRHLPAYLRALDRIVAVSSPISDFPIGRPAARTGIQGVMNGIITNGDVHAHAKEDTDMWGDDDGLGGALLEPIPWLQNQLGPDEGSFLVGDDGAAAGVDGGGESLYSEGSETINGPLGAGRVETVSVVKVNGNTSNGAFPDRGGITQGELLRQEQEAGIIPINQIASDVTSASEPSEDSAIPANYVSASAAGIEAATSPPSTASPTEEIPHARGPEEIGLEDTGPQSRPLGSLDTFDVDAAVGRSSAVTPKDEVAMTDAGGDAPSSREAEQSGEVDAVADTTAANSGVEEKEAEKDADGDVAIADASTTTAADANADGAEAKQEKDA